MALEHLQSLPPRNPANELYDRACDMLEAAQGLRHAIDRPGHEPALNATLGCLADVLLELTAAVEQLTDTTRPTSVR